MPTCPNRTSPVCSDPTSTDGSFQDNARRESHQARSARTDLSCQGRSFLSRTAHSDYPYRPELSRGFSVLAKSTGLLYTGHSYSFRSSPTAHPRSGPKHLLSYPHRRPDLSRRLSQPLVHPSRPFRLAVPTHAITSHHDSSFRHQPPLTDTPRRPHSVPVRVRSPFAPPVPHSSHPTHQSPPRPTRLSAITQPASLIDCTNQAQSRLHTANTHRATSTCHLIAPLHLSATHRPFVPSPHRPNRQLKGGNDASHLHRTELVTTDDPRNTN